MNLRKIILLTLAWSAFLPAISHASTFTVSPLVVGTDSENISVTSPDWTNLHVGVFMPATSFCEDNGGIANCGDAGFDISAGLSSFTYASPPTGIYYFVGFDTSDPNADADCENGTYSSCTGSSAYIGESYTVVYSPVLANLSMDTIIANASSTFTGAVGFNWSDVTTFMKSLLLLVIGSGLGLLETLLPYIIALVTISAIVYFLYRAFRFFRH